MPANMPANSSPERFSMSPGQRLRRLLSVVGVGSGEDQPLSPEQRALVDPFNQMSAQLTEFFDTVNPPPEYRDTGIKIGRRTLKEYLTEKTSSMPPPPKDMERYLSKTAVKIPYKDDAYDPVFHEGTICAILTQKPPAAKGLGHDYSIAFQFEALSGSLTEDRVRFLRQPDEFSWAAIWQDLGPGEQPAERLAAMRLLADETISSIVERATKPTMAKRDEITARIVARYGKEA